MKKNQAIKMIQKYLGKNTIITIVQYKNDYIATCGNGIQPILMGDNVFRGLNENYKPDKKYFDFLYEEGGK